MTTPAPSPDKLPRTIWYLTLTSLLTDVSSEMLINLVPLYLFNVLGVRTSVIGLIEGIAEATASLLKVFSGWQSDRTRRRKPLTVLGYGVSALAKPFFALVTTWQGVLTVRFAERIGKGIRTAPRDALIANSVPSSQRGRAFGIHRAGDTLGAFLGLGIALLIVAATQSGTTLTRETFQLATLISFIPAALAVLILLFGVRETLSTTAPTQARLPLSFRRLSPKLRAYLFIVLVFTLGNSADAFLILRAQERGLSVLGVLAMLMSFNLVYTLVSVPAGALSDRLGRRRLIIAGWAIYALIYLGFAAATDVWQIWLLYAAYGIYYGIFEGVTKALVGDLTDPAERGTAYGAYNTAIGLAALPASLIAGVLWQGIGGWMGFGASAPFLFGALMALLALVLFVTWNPQ